MDISYKEYQKQHMRTYRKSHPEMRERERMYAQRINYVNRHSLSAMNRTEGSETQTQEKEAI